MQDMAFPLMIALATASGGWVLATLLAENGLNAARLEESQQADVQARYDEQTQAAMDAGVFGAPSYVIDGELFWGQDRLDFVARKLRA